MRTLSLNILSKTVLVQKISQGSEKPVFEFKIDLESLAEMLCFNSPSEASDFLATQGFQTKRDPITGVNQVTKKGESGEVWKPRTNYKYIEVKKIQGNKVYSRADIIRGIACRSDTSPIIKTPINRIISKPIPNEMLSLQMPKASKEKLIEKDKLEVSMQVTLGGEGEVEEGGKGESPEET
jgi:hypothetical protein